MSFLVAIIFIIVLDIVLFLENTVYGIGGVIGIIGYFIAYVISVDIIISPREFWFQSSWQIFQKKIGFAFGTYIIITLIASSVLGVIFN